VRGGIVMRDGAVIGEPEGRKISFR